jgi:RNA recognition motif-containing protein
MQSHRLIIENIAGLTTELELIDAFRQCGAVIRLGWDVLPALASVRSAHIDMESRFGALSAIDILNRQVFHGSAIGVRLDSRPFP